MKTRNLVEVMLKQFGPLLGGKDLQQALGYRTWAAFARAVRTKQAGVHVFNIPGRRGRFALTADVATWLLEMKATNGNTPTIPTDGEKERGEA